jgi:hypothetical protein
MAIKIDKFSDLDELLNAGILGPNETDGTPPIVAPPGKQAEPPTPTALPPEGKAAMAAPDILAPGAASGEKPPEAPAVASPKPKSADILQAPLTSTGPGSQEDYRQQIANLEKPKTPWSDLGLGGKIKRGLSTAGNLALDVFAPTTAELIPGTDLNKRVMLGEARRGLQNATREDFERAQTANLGLDTPTDVKWVGDDGHQHALSKRGTVLDLGATQQKPETTDQDMALTIDAAVKAGRNPNDDPKLKALIAAKQASVQPKEPDRPMSEQEITDANASAARRWNINHKGQPLPPEYTAKAGDLIGDYTRRTAALGQEEQAGEHKQEFNQKQTEAQQKQATDNLNKAQTQYQKDWRKQYDSSTAQFDKLNQAKTEISSGASAGQAIGVITTLSGMASGQGSGVRITQAELNSMVKARGLGGDLEALKQKILDSGQPLTPDQVKQINGLIDDVQKRAGQKLAIINKGLDDINNAASDKEVKQIDNRIRKNMTSFEQGKVATSAQVQAYAQAHKISVQEAQQHAESDGYVVVD